MLPVSSSRCVNRKHNNFLMYASVFTAYRITFTIVLGKITILVICGVIVLDLNVCVCVVCVQGKDVR